MLIGWIVGTSNCERRQRLSRIKSGSTRKCSEPSCARILAPCKSSSSTTIYSIKRSVHKNLNGWNSNDSGLILFFTLYPQLPLYINNNISSPFTTLGVAELRNLLLYFIIFSYSIPHIFTDKYSYFYVHYQMETWVLYMIFVVFYCLSLVEPYTRLYTHSVRVTVIKNIKTK